MALAIQFQGHIFKIGSIDNTDISGSQIWNHQSVINECAVFIKSFAVDFDINGPSKLINIVALIVMKGTLTVVTHRIT